MTYELAEELKDHGFPQPNIVQAERDGKAIFNAEKSAWLYTPTLSELIEACEGFESLNRNVDGTWQALAPGSPEAGKEVAEGLGRTPEEAVATLWLSLDRG